MPNERLTGTCVRQGPTNPDQCAKCRFLAGPGPDIDPLVIVNHGKSGEPKYVNCLGFRPTARMHPSAEKKKAK